MKKFTRFAVMLMLGLALPVMTAPAQEMPAQRRTLTETEMQQIAAQRLERLQEMHPERYEGMDEQRRQRTLEQELQRLQRTHAQQEEKRTQRLDSLRQARHAARPDRGAPDSYPISETDSLALVALYNATNGDNWYYNDNWLTGPVNTWYGVSVWDGVVEGLYLGGNNLIGVIPDEIGNLSNLHWLELGINNLTGEIPWTIGNLNNLHWFDVSYNQLFYIPIDICGAFNSEWGDFYFPGNYFDLASCPAIECLAFNCIFMWEGWQHNGYDLLNDCLEPPIFLFDDVICGDGSAYDFPIIFWFGYPCIYYIYWQSSGTGYFDDPYDMHPLYFPSDDDYQQGCIEIYVEIESNIGFRVESMILCFDPAPQADAGGNATIHSNETFTAIQATASNYGSLLWSASGDGAFDDPTLLNPTYTPGLQDMITGSVELCLTGTTLDPAYCDDVTACMQLLVLGYGLQSITLEQGWAGISSFINPFEQDIEGLMAAIAGQLIILRDFAGNYYQPGNKELFNWEYNKGYYIKLSSEATLEISGLYPLDKALQLQQGWNLIPVLSDEPVEIEDLFWSNLPKVEIITEVAGLNVYWPNKEIITLQNLQPGKAYLVKAIEAITFTIPIVITTPVTEINNNSAISGGEVTDEGSSPVIVRGVVWGVTPNPTITHHDGMTTDGDGGGAYVSHLTELFPTKTYYLRAYATNHVGIAYGEEVIFTTLWECNYPFTDSRDGQTYNTVQIGDQCWMMENLNYQTNDSWCYNNNVANCNHYGRLYTWNAALTACPPGWHLPSDAEWTQLTNYVVVQGYPNSNVTNGAGNALKSCRQVNSPLGGDCNTTEHPRWNSHGTDHGFDAFGFSALPGGNRYTSGTFYNIGGIGYWWSATEYGSNYAWSRYLHYTYATVAPYYYTKGYGFSVRCLRD